MRFRISRSVRVFKKVLRKMLFIGRIL